MNATKYVDIYLRWEKKLENNDNSVDNPIQNYTNNYDLFDNLTLSDQEKIVGNEKLTLIRRYYSAHLHQDMLGDWVLTKARGRIGTAKGMVIHHFCSTYDDGLQLIENLKLIRKKRNYKLVIS